MLHGDLWSGNVATADGQPSIFDPAVYYGHHEVKSPALEHVLESRALATSM